MKFNISRENLLKSLQTVQNIINTKSTLPILSNILIETYNNKIRMYATDLDIGISCELPVDIVEKGSITVPAKRFNDIIKELSDDSIEIQTKKNHQIDIEGLQCRFKLKGLPKDEFPSFPKFNDQEVYQIEQGVLKEMFKMTAFAVSREESRYILNGILFEISDNTIRLVATDGRRLAKIEKKLIKTVSNKDLSVIIPNKAIHEIARNLKDDGTVSFLIGNNQVLFDIDGVLIATRIIEGEFPNYNQVIPAMSDNTITVNTQQWFAAIRRANLLSTQDFQAIKFEIFKDKMVISKNTPDIGESREEVLIDYKGDELIIGFNPHFLMDFLKNIEQETVAIEIAGPDKPAIIRLPDYLYLILPMRI